MLGPRLTSKSALARRIGGGGKRIAFLKLCFELDPVAMQRFGVVLKSRFRWKRDNRITSPANVFGDLEEASSLILLQIEEKELPLDGDFF